MRDLYFNQSNDKVPLSTSYGIKKQRFEVLSTFRRDLRWTVIWSVMTSVTFQPMTDWRVTTRCLGLHQGQAYLSKGDAAIASWKHILNWGHSIILYTFWYYSIHVISVAYIQGWLYFDMRMARAQTRVYQNLIGTSFFFVLYTTQICVKSHLGWDWLMFNFAILGSWWGPV